MAGMLAFPAVDDGGGSGEDGDARYRSLFENAVEGMYQTTPAGRYLAVNQALASLYGYVSPADLLTTLTDISHQLYVDPERRDDFKARMRRDGFVRAFEAQVYRRDGSIIWITENARCARADDGRVLYYEGTVQDVTESRRAADEIRMLATVFDTVTDGILILAGDRRVLAVNAAFTAITGRASADLIGHPPPLVAPGLHEKHFLGDIWRIVEETGFWMGEIWAERPSFEAFPADLSLTTIQGEGSVARYVVTLADITVRKRDQDRVRFEANFDMLTRLPNRTLFSDRLAQAVHQAERTGSRVCVLFLDLNRFKQVNDTFGHATGDELLKSVARRLKSCLRASDTIARIGGDEFVVLLPEVAGPRVGPCIAEKILYTLSEPFDIAGMQIFCVPSIGIANFPDDASDPEQLLRHADTAMYYAKQGDDRHYALFTPSMAQRSITLLSLESDLHLAVSHDELRLYYQPKAAADDGRIIGAEALVRWQHPVRGLVSPADFIPLAESSGLIVPIGRWVLGEACRQMMAWRAEGLVLPSMSVNVSARQFAGTTLVDTIGAILARTGLPPECLDIEVTESAVANDTDRAVTTLNALKAMGVTVSMDDFGTGYSSLAYLKIFPIDTLKIDQSFVRGLLTEPRDAAIIAAIIALAHNLGFSVVAEGVETPDHAARLADMGCDSLQGYWLARPLPDTAATTFLRQRLTGLREQPSETTR